MNIDNDVEGPTFPPGADARYFGKILDALADPVFVKDEQHRWVTLNDAMCEFMGHPRAFLLGKSDFEIFPFAEATVFWAKDDEVFTSGRESFNEERFTDAQGVTHEIATKKSLYVTELGQKFIVGVIRDLTERKREEREAAQQRAEHARMLAEQIARLQQLDSLKEQFVSTLSHELRTPIHTIMGTATILEDELLGPLNDEQRQFLARMIRSTEGLLGLVNDLLDMSLIQSGQFKISPRQISLGEVVSGVLGNLEPLAAEKQLVLEDGLEAELPTLEADEQRVGQVLANLVSNAIKFTPNGGRVRVTAEVEAGAWLRCVVTDTGPGIEAADVDRLFQRFSQLGPGNTRVVRGTGLGLAISKSLIEAHGGAIGVDSVPGSGARFWFTLPLSTTP